jgi:toxin ParE1/3/4
VRVVLTSLALTDLDEVERFVARDGPAAAIDTVLRLLAAIELLALHPEAGRPGRVPGTRELVVTSTPYGMPYRVRDNAVEVLRVLHGRRRWPERL